MVAGLAGLFLPETVGRKLPGTNCIKIGLTGKSILGDYFQENRSPGRPFLLLRISFPGRPIFIQLPPETLEDAEAQELDDVWLNKINAVIFGEKDGNRGKV